MPDHRADRRRYVAAVNLRLRAASQLYKAASLVGLTRRTRQQAVYDWTFRSDEQVLKYSYAAVNDHLPSLDQPVWLNEKIRWQFLHHLNPLMSLAADKIAVRRYLLDVGCVVDPPALVAVGSSPEELLDTQLPSQFVLKSAHGSAQIFIEDGARRATRAELAARVAEWNCYDWWRRCGEFHYREIPKRWLVEEYISASWEKLEYKVFCFMGEPRFVTVITERDGETFKRVTMDLNWKRVTFSSKGHPPDVRDVPAPPDLDLILAEAKRLSQHFLHVRVDFLKFDGRLVFSELTFAAMGALIPFEPIEANVEIGELMDLTQADARLETGRRIAARLDWPT